MTKPITDSRQPIARRLRRWMICAIVLLAIGYWLSATPALAQLNTGIGFGTGTGLSTQDIRVTIAKIIRAVLGLLGIVALVIVIYGGFLWMTAGGSEDRITDAKKWLTNGAIGLTIILLSVSITQFVISRLNQALYGSGTVRTTGGFEDNFLSGALGAGPIESHFPTRGAQDVARNTRIFITFREPVYPASIAADTNGNTTIGTTGVATTFDNYRDLALPEAIQVTPVGVNVDPTKLTPAAKIADAAGFAVEAAKLVPVGFAIAAGGRTIVLSPVVMDGQRVAVTPNGYARRALLGNAQTNTAYLVRITSAVKKATTRTDGTHEDLFTGAFRDGYAWDFTVSTTIDLTPPKVTSVIPFPDAGRDTTSPAAVVGVVDQPRNILVQVNFNEAMDPTVTTGTLTRAEVDNNIDTNADSGTGFKHLVVQNQAAMVKRLAGTFAISNQYRTVEFTTDEECGQNSCGGKVYCLPGNAELRAWAEAATLEAGGPSGLPFSGVMDAAGNSLDGNGNSRAEGPVSRYDRTLESPTGGDSVQWKFFTTNTIDLSAPEIEKVVHFNKQDRRVEYSTIPTGGADKISLTKPLEILFSKLMSGNVTVGLRVSEEPGGCNLQTGQGCIWSSASAAHEPVAPATTLTKTRVTMDHASFRDAQPGFDLVPPQYRVRVDSSVKDVYQNCFFTIPPTGSSDLLGPHGPTGGRSCTGACP